ncbi:glucan biosynthesis protein G [Pseudomonas brassicacearum]|uniref:Glucans biosynthesis protein G n=2 Tax=Pseudomonas TaxID=286 RepID=F2KDB2_PSEBN|nr:MULTISPECIES: glucan biosynthesis protein G [Pseudomonas]EIK70310.1 periplasmic glucan biosynthesis protein MdoG [Pseudomonas fluorescens Q8r1-96]KIR13473.1 Glucans biosynthesis protein G precursor [Pseudomonas fluorescens]AEA66532.1 Glucans biosynthesis protein [Pseudomonas brassicacearum subsp. brassicacearum NFM421]AOS42851.1 glucan biosynthesis protein G [Pseudomonas brassicacearum]KAB0522728.1 glucan biosynthesis protein G [Pseudomonas brassicacearum subsp. brassicacearum]
MIVSPCNAPKMTAKRLRSALVTGSALLCLFGAGQLWAFSLDDVSAKAQELAGQKYEAPRSNLPNEFREMKFADYQKIRFRTEKAEWADQKTPFRLSFYHQGMHFDTPVKINEITATTVEEIKYDPSRFDFDDVKFDPKATEQLGYAGFRVLYPINKADKQDEIMTMLGASYFRVIGKGQTYGLSARGMAIDTALPSGEEFPRFREFWIQRPKPTDKHLVIFALLDSPRATGAYRLTLRPGTDTVVDVKSRMFLRDRVTKLGVAPLTSMYLFGANQPSKVLNYRRELHDSSGLSIHAGNGEWIWRPLNNPKHLAVSNFSVENPRGFGLLQRGRDFSHYEDLDDRYDKRPSAWIEPKGDWGKGSVDLVEIPTADETNDNIVAFWSPEKLPEPGQPLDFSYRLHWTLDEASLHSPDSAWVQQTLRSTGDVKQSNLIRQPDGSVAYLVDFEGPSLQALPEDADVRSQVSVGENGEIVENSVRYNPETKGWRLTLRLKIKDSKQATEMRAALVRPLTPVEAPATAHSVTTTLAKADKVARQQTEKELANEKAKDEAKAVKAADAAVEPTPTQQEPEPTEQVLTETWSYQLPADE